MTLVIVALAVFAASAASAAAPVLSLKVDGGYSMNLELFRPNSPSAPWAGVHARPCAAGRPAVVSGAAAKAAVPAMA